MAHRAAPGRALSPYLLTQGADEPFQVLLLVQHHLLLLVLLLQLHLQLPELCGRNAATLSATGKCWGFGIPQERECTQVFGDQEWAVSPGAPPTPGSARDLQDFGDRMGHLRHTQTCPKAAPAALEFVFAPTKLTALRKGYFLQSSPNTKPCSWCPWYDSGVTGSSRSVSCVTCGSHTLSPTAPDPNPDLHPQAVTEAHTRALPWEHGPLEGLLGSTQHQTHSVRTYPLLAGLLHVLQLLILVLQLLLVDLLHPLDLQLQPLMDLKHPGMMQGDEDGVNLGSCAQWGHTPQPPQPHITCSR